jgi:DNA-binding MarR family transcriptional regulator
MQQETEQQQELAQSIRMLRRVLWRDTLLSMMGQLGVLDLSFNQLGTLLYLEHEGEVSLSAVAAMLARSLPATSRLVDGLVQRGFVARAEGQADRRSKRLRLTDGGRRFIAALEQGRVDAQLAVMERLSPADYADVARAMRLLAQAAAGRQHDEQHQGDAATDDSKPITEQE